MRRRVSTVGAALALAVLIAVCAPGAFAQQVPFSPTRATEVGELLRRGRQLEGEHRWGEALTHYEEAIRSFPDDNGLDRQFELARMHCDLGRRYSDASFREDVARMPVQRALDLYAEVLLKVQSHYVDAPQWRTLVEQGARGLEVALSEPAFVKEQLPTASKDAIEALEQALRQSVAGLPIENRDDARVAVAAAAEEARSRLGIRPAAVVLEYLCGAVCALDPYSAYLTPDQLSDVYSQIEGNFVGLGIELKVQDGVLLVVRVIGNSPAQRGGIRAQDRILAVNGQVIENLSTEEAANLLQGEPGSAVHLSVATPGQAPRQLTLRRQRVDVPSVDDVKMLDADSGIGYFKLTCFQKTTVRDLDTALWNLYRQGMRGLVIDLRGNPGGLLVTAVDVVDRFVGRGVIVSTYGRSAQEGFTYTAHAPGTWQVPLVVVIDQDSASAAEIFAGAIRDHQRGKLVGRRSYGKGSVQGIFPLNTNNSGLRLTTAKFYSPNGQPFSLVGVQPDINVYQVAKPTDDVQPLSATDPNDAILQQALQTARDITMHRSAQK